MGHLNELGAVIAKINEENGWVLLTRESWGETHHVPAMLALIHSEVSEAVEAWREDEGEHFAEELADVVIRVLDVATGLGIDMDVAVAQKLAKNRQRAHRHGGKRL